LKEYQELTFLEIAEVLGLPPSTAKTRLYRGLTLLRERLERQGIRSATAVPAPSP
jgi:RNA polymerase sigma-70 factor (ECF subfamily)